MHDTIPYKGAWFMCVVRMYVCMYVCMHVCMDVSVTNSRLAWLEASVLISQVCTQVSYMHLFECLCMCACAYKKRPGLQSVVQETDIANVCRYAFMYVFGHVCMYVFTYVCMYVCMYVYSRHHIIL